MAACRQCSFHLIKENLNGNCNKGFGQEGRTRKNSRSSEEGRCACEGCCTSEEGCCTRQEGCRTCEEGCYSCQGCRAGEEGCCSCQGCRAGKEGGRSCQGCCPQGCRTGKACSQEGRRQASCCGSFSQDDLEPASGLAFPDGQQALRLEQGAVNLHLAKTTGKPGRRSGMLARLPVQACSRAARDGYPAHRWARRKNSAVEYFNAVAGNALFTC